MPSPIIKGSLLPLLQEESFDFDPTRGYLHMLHFRGASQIQMLALQQDFARAGIACRINFHQGDTATLEVQDSTQQYVIDSWELAGSDESRDGLSHPTILQMATEQQVAAMRQHLENNDNSVTAFTDPVLVDLAGTDVQGIYILIERGSTDYYRSNYVLRHRTNAPNRWTANIADFGVEQIYTPAQLLTEIASTALWAFPCPLRLRYKISLLDYGMNNPYVPKAVTQYQWGWLKGTSTETTAANNRIDIIQEYRLEQWSTIYYQPFTGVIPHT